MRLKQALKFALDGAAIRRKSWPDPRSRIDIVWYHTKTKDGPSMLLRHIDSFNYVNNKRFNYVKLSDLVDDDDWETYQRFPAPPSEPTHKTDRYAMRIYIAYRVIPARWYHTSSCRWVPTFACSSELITRFVAWLLQLRRTDHIVVETEHVDDDEYATVLDKEGRLILKRLPEK